MKPLRLLSPLSLLPCLFLCFASALRADFGWHEGKGGAIEIDTGAGLAFEVTPHGDIDSILYHGIQLQDPHYKNSGVSSGLGASRVVATRVGENIVKVTCTTPTITHYYLARRGESVIYLATYTTKEPNVGELRYIFRLNTATLTQAPQPSDHRGTTGNIESKDIFGMPNGTTRSKFYGSTRDFELDEHPRGATGPGVGVYMIFGNREKSSSGPFFHDIEFQTDSQNEVYNYMNSGHNRTEPDRMGLHGPYALAVTSGPQPAKGIDFSWIAAAPLDLTGFVPPGARGRVDIGSIVGLDHVHPYLVGFANPENQYWTHASDSDGSCHSPLMIPGNYTMTVYKGELAVATAPIAVAFRQITKIPSIAITKDPSSAPALWRIGDWDGTPLEFRNGTLVTSMHPSDPRLASWKPGPYTIGKSAPSDFPCYQWRDINSPQEIRFTLTPDQARGSYRIRVGITAAYAGGRPVITVNSWHAPEPQPSEQPKSRSLTIGTYRGNNATFAFDVPSDALVAGANVLKISATGNRQSYKDYLSPSYSFDCVDMVSRNP